MNCTMISFGMTFSTIIRVLALTADGLAIGFDTALAG